MSAGYFISLSLFNCELIAIVGMDLITTHPHIINEIFDTLFSLLTYQSIMECNVDNNDIRELPCQYLIT